MAIMSSGTNRFKTEKPTSVTPFGAYHVDSAHKKSVASSVRGNFFLACQFCFDLQHSMFLDTMVDRPFLLT